MFGTRAKKSFLLLGTVACIFLLLRSIPLKQYSIQVGVAIKDVKATSALAVTAAALNSSTFAKVASYGLPKSVIERVGRFLLFFGSGRSGHSIVGSLLDAHKHVVVSHEFHLFRKWYDVKGKNEELWVENIYNELYLKSWRDSVGIRREHTKGYSLRVEGLWQGRYDSYISVIGDKSGGSTRQEYMRDKTEFKERMDILSSLLRIPIFFIHVVRNPYDHVASRVLYDHVGNISAVSTFKHALKRKKFADKYLVMVTTKEMLSFYEAEEEMINLFKPGNVLEIHIADLITTPKRTLQHVMDYLGVPVTNRYLQICAAKVYRSSSRARDYIEWPVEAKEMLGKAIGKYKFLRKYSFSSD